MQGENEQKGTNGRVYCANCSHCVVFKQPIESTDAYVLRVRCSIGMWKKKSGDEKIYKYFSIIRRILSSRVCEVTSTSSSSSFAALGVLGPK